MRFVITGGGTGGHIYPALAIAQGLLRKYPAAQLLYLGRAGGLEEELVPRAGIPFYPLALVGLKRRPSLQNLLALYRAAKGVWVARKVLREFRPRAVIGTGGYVCGPVILAAALLGLPTLIHEQNALPGLTNRLLAPFVTRVALTFEEARRYLPRRARVAVTGLPVRAEILSWRREEARRAMGLPPDALLVLSFGGSQGARSINEAMLEVLKEFQGREGVFFLHVTGPGQYENFLQQAAAGGLRTAQNGNIILVPYLHEMPRALAAADLAICRAGAATLAELTATGLPAVLVPYPYATGNHQEHNARVLERAGAALVVPDRQLTGRLLVGILRDLLGQPERLAAMSRASRRMGRPQALESILSLVEEIAG